MSAMTVKEYCSQVCGAKCCRAHEPIVWPARCPKLTEGYLCSIYEHRIGFTFDARDSSGGRGVCICSTSEVFLKSLPAEIKAQCCIAHPELLQGGPQP